MEEHQHRTIVSCLSDVPGQLEQGLALSLSLKYLLSAPESTARANLGLEQWMHLPHLPASRKLPVLNQDVPLSGAACWGSELCSVTSRCSPVSTSACK